MKKALGINAVFSGLSGILIIILRNQLANLFGIGSATPFLITGIVLVFFSVTIIFEIKRQNTAAILWIIVQDMLWVIGSILILLLDPFGISTTGNYIILAVAIIVFLMAVHQGFHLMFIDSLMGSETNQVVFTRIVPTSKKEAWKVVSDVANYHHVAPNIDDVKIISGEGKGMVRTCSHGKNKWSETCTLWDEERRYSFVVDTKTPSYPFPFKHLIGTWEITEIEPNKTEIVMIFDFAYNKRIMNLLLHPILRIKFKKIAEELLDNWEKMLTKK